MAKLVDAQRIQNPPLNKRVGSSPTLGTTYKPLIVGQGFFFYVFQPVKSISYVHIRYKFIINPNLKYCHFLSIFIYFCVLITPMQHEMGRGGRKENGIAVARIAT